MSLDWFRKQWWELGWKWRQRKLRLNRAAIARTVVFFQTVRGESKTFDQVEQTVRRFWTYMIWSLPGKISIIVKAYRYHAGLTKDWPLMLSRLLFQLEGVTPGASKMTFSTAQKEEDLVVTVTVVGGRSVDVGRSGNLFTVNGNHFFFEIDYAARDVWQRINAK